ncbi:unnamed protein product [Acanthoscelides obtectus]|nr:unnamed protein product [Acanthoscelides obtectus]CAK1678225.1 Meckel syndrome type 1 protein homolog [Acanthoscelides obtectus]
MVDDPNEMREEKKWLSQEFRWQEKHFSKVERDFYGDINNCITDIAKIYNEKVVNASDETEENLLFFTYVDKDGYVSEKELVLSKPSYLQKWMKTASVPSQEHREDKSHSFDYVESVTDAIQNRKPKLDITKMYLMADFGCYVDDIWIRNEQPLCVLQYDNASEVLSVYPDFTTDTPYLLHIQDEVATKVYYFVEKPSDIDSEQDDELFTKEKEVVELVQKKKRSLQQELIGETFAMPPKSKLYVYIFFEILSGKHFDQSDLWVQYSVDLPEFWTSQDCLRGITQQCHAVSVEGLMHFGHTFDFVLEYDLQSLQGHEIPKTPYIYLEVISKTVWNCYRREGFTYKNLPVSRPGCYTYNLSCCKFNNGGFFGGIKRYFVGDSKCADIRWIGLPQEYDHSVINKFSVETITTGELVVRMNVVHQSHAFLDELHEENQRKKFIYEKLNASGLIKSVNQVLLNFKKARKDLIEVRKQL